MPIDFPEVRVDTEPVRTGDRVAGRFDIEAAAGSGGMGALWRARDVLTGAAVALKLAHGQSPMRVARFAREVELLATFSHPAIVRYLAHGMTAEGALFLAMEWLEGEDLAVRLRRGPLSVTEATTLVLRVSEGLCALHARRLVHRDVKPGNLFLVDGSIERVKIVDFGLARPLELDAALTRSGVLVGTPGYMAPEQVEGWEIEASADVFALGCVLYRCLTGADPFPGASATSRIDKLVLDEPPPITELAPHVPEALARLTMRMLSKDPGARPADGAAVESMLRRAAGLAGGSSDAPTLSLSEDRTIPDVAHGEDTRFSPGDRVAGRYRLEQRLSRTLMASVWVARDERLDRNVAVKLLAEHLMSSPNARARFDAEATAVARLRSHHVVQLHDYGIDGATPFMVMELLHGESLAERLSRTQQLSSEEALDMVAQICRGLSVAHAAGVVHRDIKPSNIFIASMPEEPSATIKLLDFGLVKLLDPSATELTASGTFVGSMPYVSPEQVRRDRAIDHRADLWSLGATLYEALTRTAPFGKDSLALMRIAHESAAPPSTLAPHLSSAIDRFFVRALARDREARFQSAQEFSAELARAFAKPRSSRAPWVFVAVLMTAVAILVLLLMVR